MGKKIDVSVLRAALDAHRFACYMDYLELCELIDKLPQGVAQHADYTCERLTDDRTYHALRDNCDGLISCGVKPDVSALRYIKLAEYEREELENDT